MKILLINPDWSHLYTNKTYKKRVKGKFMPIGLLYIASNLIVKGNFDVSVIDLEVERLSKSKLNNRIKNINPNIVGIYATTPLFTKTKKIAKNIKILNKEIKIILGGPHVTALPEESLRECKYIDFVVRGEGETTMVNLCQSIEKRVKYPKIKGISLRYNDKIISFPNRRKIENLDNLPNLPLHLLKVNLYQSIPISTSRGCPFKCIFCYPMFGNSVRFRTSQKVIDEIEFLVNKYNVNFINFVDDTFTLNKKRALEIFDKIIERGLNKKIKWGCTTRVDSVDKELLQKMKDSGCVRISFGVESGNPKILKSIKKGITIEQVYNAFKYCNDVGIETLAFFMLGHPLETEKTIKETISLAKKIKPTHVEFGIMTPLPGTELNSMTKKNWNKVKTKEEYWGQHFFCNTGLVKLKNISRRKLVRYQKMAFYGFYFRLPKLIEIVYKNIEYYLKVITNIKW